VPDADVVVKNFEVVETFNDRVLWSLRAKGAEVYSAQKERILKGSKPTFLTKTAKASTWSVTAARKMMYPG